MWEKQAAAVFVWEGMLGQHRAHGLAYGGLGAFLLNAERKGHLKKALREFLSPDLLHALQCYGR